MQKGELKSDASKLSCRLCGLPVGRSRVHLEENGEHLSFCCTGCMQVHRILTGPGGVAGLDFKSTDLYRRFLKAGIIGGSAIPSAASQRPERDREAGIGLELTMRVEGMWCAACAWLVESILARTPGILTARVNFLADLASITYLPHRIRPQEIAEVIAGLGYRTGNETRQQDDDRRDSHLRLGVASILTFNVMMISFALYGGFFQQIGRVGILALSLPLGLLSAPVLFYSGAPILKRAWHGLVNRCPGMDTLIAVGACTAFGYSVYQVLVGSLHLYFDTAAMLITLVLFGRLIENRAREQVTGALRNLEFPAGNKIRILSGKGERWVAAPTVAPGDLVMVRAGERVPVDGRVACGCADVDEGVLTGEPRPRGKKEQDQVFAGSLLVTGELQLIAERVGRDSSLGRVRELVLRALTEKNQLEQLADRIMRFFVPLLFVLAFATGLFLILGGASPETAVLRAITVLVIACPCALGIATPLAKTAIITRARNQGAIISNPAAFEAAAQVDTIIFDKTGTVTEGRYCLRAIHVPGGNEREVLCKIVAAEADADHFLAREIRRQAEIRGIVPPRAAEQRCYAGLGVVANVHSEEIIVGSPRLMDQRGCEIDRELQALASTAEARGDSVVFAAWRHKVAALLIFGDVLRPCMGTMIQELRLRGLELWLVSGDSTATTAAVAHRLGIDRFSGSNTPEDKAKLLAELQAQGRRVAMIGDGANDLAALARADLGIAVGGNPLDLAGESADLTILSGSPVRIPEVFDLSRCMVRTIRLNLCLAFIYNAIGIPLAMTGLLNPLFAVLAMFASSLTVFVNSLRAAHLSAKRGGIAVNTHSVSLTDRGVSLQ
jgi:heavy metal translocating P-type ATPase